MGMQVNGSLGGLPETHMNIYLVILPTFQQRQIERAILLSYLLKMRAIATIATIKQPVLVCLYHIRCPKCFIFFKHTFAVVLRRRRGDSEPTRQRGRLVPIQFDDFFRIKSPV